MRNRMETNRTAVVKEPCGFLSKPLSVREQWMLCNEDAYLEGFVAVNPAELVVNDLKGLLTLLSERLVGDPFLRDVTYQAEGVTSFHHVIVRVRGCIDECEPSEKEMDAITAEICDGILALCNDDALSKLIGEPVDGKTGKEKEQQVLAFLEISSIWDLIRYYKTYAMPAQTGVTRTEPEPETTKTYLIAGLQYDPESYMTKEGMKRLMKLLPSEEFEICHIDGHNNTSSCFLIDAGLWGELEVKDVQELEQSVARILDDVNLESEDCAYEWRNVRLFLDYL
ncbi:hypothetical protein DW085_17540 [Clostridium sp. AF50-3]|uniref:hypothetical protein n=1 Tax=Clostridium sp. AF50-3 TaxID=2293021 RepID=UPI000E4BA9F2|nr:hypothetical protein [Clostridium sp. AF50-3]RHO63757.1 hypothetical protein DW085_17540 [Clostridium sp. AF50-3]